MAESTWVDTDRMAKVAPQVDELERKLGAVHDALVAGVAPLDGAAGDDAPGRAFYDTYSTTRDQIVGATRDLRTITGSIRDGITTMINGYSATEEDNIVNQPPAAQ